MKRDILLVLLTVISLLSACGGNAVQPTPTADSVMDNVTSTPSPLPTTMQTATPAATLTASITPLPPIPTFTPTFDVRTIVTVTPASPAECPKEDPNLSFTLIENHDYPLFDPQEILALLNKGASFKTISSIVNNPKSTPVITAQDVTGDKTPELLFINFEPIRAKS